MKNNEQYGAYDYEDTFEPTENISEEDIENEFSKVNNAQYDDPSYKLNNVMKNHPKVIKYNQMSKEEKTDAFRELMDMLNNPNCTDADRDYAYMEATYCLYALIRNLVSKYCGTFVNENNFEDFMSTGYTAIYKNMRNYNPDICAPATFFYEHIKHELIAKISKERSTSRYYNEKITQVNKVISQYAAQGKEATPVDITVATGLPPLTVNRVLTAISSQNQASLEEVEYLVSDREADNPEKQAQDNERSEIISKVMDFLILRDGVVNGPPTNVLGLLVMQMKYGFYTGAEMSQTEIAKELTKIKKEKLIQQAKTRYEYLLTLDKDDANYEDPDKYKERVLDEYNKIDVKVDTVRKYINNGTKTLRTKKFPIEILTGYHSTDKLPMYVSLAEIFSEYNMKKDIQRKENLSRENQYNDETVEIETVLDLLNMADEDF